MLETNLESQICCLMHNLTNHYFSLIDLRGLPEHDEVQAKINSDTPLNWAIYPVQDNVNDYTIRIELAQGFELRCPVLLIRTIGCSVKTVFRLTENIFEYLLRHDPNEFY